MAEQNTEQTIMVRQVTDVHSNWSHQGELEPGKFSYQLIFDNGAEEVLIMPTAEDGKLLRSSSMTRMLSTGTPRTRSSYSAR